MAVRIEPQAASEARFPGELVFGYALDEVDEPPVGVVLYVTARVANISFERVTRATLPFLVPLLVVLLAITLWPPLTTWLPQLVLGGQR